MKELTLAEKLRLLRGKETQKDAAARAGIPPATLCKLERAQRGVSNRKEAVAQRQATLSKLAAAYGVLPEYLTGDLPTYMREFVRHLTPDPGATAGRRMRSILEELRLRYSITTQDLEQPLGLSTADLDAMCQDQLNFTISALGRIQEVLGVPPTWLQLGQGYAPQIPTDLYRRSLELAAEAGMPPAELEKLIQGWLDRHQEEPRATQDVVSSGGGEG